MPSLPIRQGGHSGGDVSDLQCGFAYGGVNGQASDFKPADAQYVQVAVGW
jgi:hypothetical protein